MTEEDVSGDDTKVIFFGPDSFESIFLKANVYNLLKYSLWKKIYLLSTWLMLLVLASVVSFYNTMFWAISSDA